MKKKNNWSIMLMLVLMLGASTYRAQNEAYKESESLKMGKGVVCQ